jgi:hypothetical protein
MFTYLYVHADQDYGTEVGVDCVAYKDGAEDDPPRCGEHALNLKGDEHGEEDEADERAKDLEGRQSQPVKKLLQLEIHVGRRSIDDVLSISGRGDVGQLDVDRCVAAAVAASDGAKIVCKPQQSKLVT